MRTIAFLLSLILIFMVPWEDVINLPSLGTAARSMGLAVAAFWVATVVITRQLRKPSAFHIAAGLFVLWNVLSVLWSANTDRSLVQITTYIQLLGLTLILWDLCTTRGALLATLQMYILGAYVLLGNTLINYFSGSTYYYERFSANGTNPDDLGLILALGLPVASYLASSMHNSKLDPLLKLVNYTYIPAAFLGIALSGTRTALVAALPGMVFSIASLNRPRLRTRIAIFVLTIGATIVLLPLIPDASLQRLSTTGSELAGGDLNGRASLWRQGFESFVEHPLIGVGANMFRSVNSIGKVAHNTYLSVAVELGLIGFALFMLMIAIAVRQAWRQRKWDRRLWLAVLVALAIGAFTLTWENRKPTWLFLSLAIVSAGVVENRDKITPFVQTQQTQLPTPLSTRPMRKVVTTKNTLFYE